MKTLLISIKIFFFFTLLTGVIYPLLVTGFANLLFANKANGSLLYKNNNLIGSSLIGQKFDTSVYFSSRPSSTDYGLLPSGGSNYGQLNPKLQLQFATNKKHFFEFNNLMPNAEVPPEMAFSSASGCDPHISPAAAFSQINRIAMARNFTAAQKNKLRQLVINQTEHRQLFFLGEERINVLRLNLSVDTIQ